MSNSTIDRFVLDNQVSTIKPRCWACSKKIGLIQFPCKCGGIYCSVHRADSTHNCSYDYKIEQKNHLSTNMVKLMTKKVEEV